MGGAFDLVVATSRLDRTFGVFYDGGDAGFQTDGEVRVQTGFGLQLKGGMQWVPIPGLRIGRSVATPTYVFALLDRFSTTFAQGPAAGTIDPVNPQAAGGVEQRGASGGRSVTENRLWGYLGDSMVPWFCAAFMSEEQKGGIMSEEKEYDQHASYRSGKFTGFDMDWYDKLREGQSSWTKDSEYRAYQNRGIPVHVKAGQVVKFLQPEGPNILDVWFFGADIKDTAGEQYDPIFTAGLEGFICRKNSRLWSNLPYFRPMATYIDDNIDPSLMPDEHHWPVWHGGHCSPELNEMGFDIHNHASCHTNCIEALVTAGMDFEKADSFAATHNMCVFQPMAVSDQPMPGGHVSPTWHSSPSNLKSGTWVEFYAEIDLLLAISHCPYGNQSKPPHEVDHYPIDIEVWNTNVTPQERPEWTDWRPGFKKRLERLKVKGNTGAIGRYYGEE